MSRLWWMNCAVIISKPRSYGASEISNWLHRSSVSWGLLSLFLPDLFAPIALRHTRSFYWLGSIVTSLLSSLQVAGFTACLSRRMAPSLPGLRTIPRSPLSMRTRIEMCRSCSATIRCLSCLLLGSQTLRSLLSATTAAQWFLPITASASSLSSDWTWRLSVVRARARVRWANFEISTGKPPRRMRPLSWIRFIWTRSGEFFRDIYLLPCTCDSKRAFKCGIHFKCCSYCVLIVFRSMY